MSKHKKIFEQPHYWYGYSQEIALKIVDKANNLHKENPKLTFYQISKILNYPYDLLYPLYRSLYVFTNNMCYDEDDRRITHSITLPEKLLKLVTEMQAIKGVYSRSEFITDLLIEYTKKIESKKMSLEMKI